MGHALGAGAVDADSGSATESSSLAADPDLQAALQAVRLTFPAWVIWADDRGWHARRRGRYRQDHQAGAGVYYLFHPELLVFVLLLDGQDQIEPAPDEQPARPPLTIDVRAIHRGLRRVIWPDPITLARDVIAARIAADHPGYMVTHDDRGWYATPVDGNGRLTGDTIKAESSPGLVALLPVRRLPLPGADR